MLCIKNQVPLFEAIRGGSGVQNQVILNDLDEIQKVLKIVSKTDFADITDLWAKHDDKTNMAATLTFFGA